MELWRVSFPFQLRQARALGSGRRSAQRGAPALRAEREEAPGPRPAGGRASGGAPPGPAGRGKGRGRPPARFRELGGRSRRFGEKGPESGSGARGGQLGAAGGARPRPGVGRAAGRVRGGRARGAAAPGGNPSHSPRETLRLRPLCADDAGPRVPSSETRAGG